MQHRKWFVLITLYLFLGRAGARDMQSFNDAWKFARFGPMPDGSLLVEPQGLEKADFDDSAWRILDVPHDWGIEGPFRAGLPNRTGKLPWAGIGWYRKTFMSPASDAGKRVYIDFDGAMSGTAVWLNGKRVRMNGVCQHHDLGPLGTAVHTRALERQIEMLQSMGCNAIRTSHNPPASELLDLCDRMGMLVQVEAFDAWARQKAPNDYARHFKAWHERDLVHMVRRDRNHPCVVMWSTGNEVLEFNFPEEAAVSQMLTDIVHREDPTRPVTFGGNKPNVAFNGFAETVDVFGYNYKPHLYQKFREAYPHHPLYGSETASTVSSRGEYFFPVSNDKAKGAGGYFQVSSYDLSAPKWANRPDIEFEAQDRYPWVFGEFVWTGFDYLGEPTPYNKDKTNLLNFSDPEKARQAYTAA